MIHYSFVYLINTVHMCLTVFNHVPHSRNRLLAADNQLAVLNRAVGNYIVRFLLYFDTFCLKWALRL